MPKKDSERHSHFISVVFLPAEGRAVEAAAKRAHLKKSAFIRQVVLDKIGADKPPRRRK